MSTTAVTWEWVDRRSRVWVSNDDRTDLRYLAPYSPIDPIIDRDRMVPVIGRTTVRVRKEAENVSHDNPSELFAESASVAEGRDVGVCNECRAPEFES